MFQILHRIYVFGWGALLAGALLWVSVRASIPETVSDWYAVWQNKPEHGEHALEDLTGKVTKVNGGASLTLRSSEGHFYSIGLAGVVPPNSAPGARKAEREMAEKCKARLSELTLSNDVHVGVLSLDAQRRGIGVVRVGDTNVNAVLVESGLAELRREFIKALPAREQYALIRAERKAKERKSRGALVEVSK